MKFEKFEDIIAWQKSRQFTILIYQSFRQSKDFGFRDQVERASVSIMNNIAEGFESRSDQSFRQFLYIAKGSAGEVRSMLYLGNDLGYIKKEPFERLLEMSLEISRLISGLIKTLC